MGQIISAFITVNPAIGLTYFMDEFKLGSINRCETAPVVWADGKALIGARAFKAIGGNPLAVFPCGGRLGQELVNRLSYDKINITTTPITNEIRRTYSISDMSHNPPLETHLLEKGPELSNDEQNRFLQVASKATQEFNICCVSGSLPAGCKSDFYFQLIQDIKYLSKCKILLDTSDQPLIEAVGAGPDYLKINEEEFSFITKMDIGQSRDALLEHMARLSKEKKIDTVIITRGAESVLTFSQSFGSFEVIPPEIEVINTVGCGDCFSAGFILKIDESLEDGLKMAVAVASANAIGRVPGEFNLINVFEFLPKIRINKM